MALSNLPGSEAPNHGMLLRADDLLHPNHRGAARAVLRFCNLAVWYVSPEYRTSSIRMVTAVLAQEGFHFTDFTPIEVVQRLNLRLGFQCLDTDTALAPNLLWPTIPSRITISV
jgi:hypothetical protein